MGQVIRIVGAPASGKTTLRRALAAALGWPSFAIDEERLRLMGPADHWPDDDRPAWWALRDALETNERCIVETSGLSQRDAWLYEGQHPFVVLCVAEYEVRMERLRARVAARERMARTKDYVSRVGSLPDLPAVTPDVVWHGDGAGTAELAELMRLIGNWAPAEVAA